MNSQRFLLTLTLVLCACLALPQSMNGFTVSPGIFRSPVIPGKVGTLRLTLENFEPAPMNATLRISSVVPESGSYRMKLGEKHERDASSWFLKKEQKVVVRRDQKLVVEMQFKAPAVKPGSFWCMAELLPTFGSGQAKILYQIPIFFYAGNRPPRPDLRLSTPSLQVAGRKAKVLVPLENAGDGMLTVVVRADIRDAQSGRLLQRIQDVDRDIYPHTSRVIPIEAKGLADGNYVVSTVTQMGLRNFSPMQQAVSVRGGKVTPLSKEETKELSALSFNPSALLKAEPAGGRRTYAVALTNSTAQPITVDLSLGKLVQQPNGSFVVSAEQPSTVVLSISPGQVVLPPKGSRTIKVTAEIPKGAKGDTWFGVEAQPVGVRMMAEQLVGRIAIPNTGEPSLALRSLGLEKINGRASAMTLEIKNKGNAAVVPLATARVLKDGVRVVADLEVPMLGDGGVLPGAILQNRIPIPLGLAPGSYLVSVTYQFSETQSDRITERFTVTAPKKAAPPKKAGKR
jgi:hypothetical protein